MTEIGSITLIISGGITAFSIFLTLIGMNLRTKRSITRSLTLSLIDRFTKRNAKKSLDRSFSRFLLSGWNSIASFSLKKMALSDRSMALSLSRQALYINTAIVSFAFFVLIFLMFTLNLRSEYVVKNTSADMSLIYRLTGTWAGSSGSLLLWYFLLTVATAIVLHQTKNFTRSKTSMMLLIIGFLQLLFVVLTVYFKDGQPFRIFPLEMKAGRGMNPLLHHWAMILHPPILFIGYVSFAIPFALAMAALVSGTFNNYWLPLIRRWALFSWFFLGVGILLGSMWAYEELGWGGYWAWDPVENASLMPFLLSTAFLHSLLVQDRRGMFRFWNILLITLTHHFCLLGTWITRSGVIAGPHSFAKSTIGYPLIIFIGLSSLFFLRYLYFYRNSLKPKHNMEAVLSKEGSMLLNNYIIILITAVVLFGVFSPMIPVDCTFAGGSLACHKTEWKPPVYNRIIIPIALLALFLMAAAPILPWKKRKKGETWNLMMIPLGAGILTALVFTFYYRLVFRFPATEGPWGKQSISDFMAIVTISISVMIIAGIIQAYVRGIRARKERHPDENILRGFLAMIFQNKKRYFGYFVHLGVAFLFIGFAGGAFRTQTRMEFHYVLMPREEGTTYLRYYSGDKAYLFGYELEAKDLFFRPMFQDKADKTNPSQMTVSQEAHFSLRPLNEERSPRTKEENKNSYQIANFESSLIHIFKESLIHMTPKGRLVTERRYFPDVNPVTGEIITQGQFGQTVRTGTSEPSIRTGWIEDIYVQLGNIKEPSTNSNPDFAWLYEYYYFTTDHSDRFYSMLFPPTIVAYLEVWINPLMRFVWFGFGLFFISGLFLLLPYGDKEPEKLP